VESLFANAQEYERRHRFDLPGIHARYLRVVTTCPDLSQDLVRKAAEKAGDLEGRLKDAYRLLRNEDPDALQGATNVRIKAMVLTVARDLSSRDAALRERAARILGLLGHPEAVYDLSKALDKETEEAPAAAAIEALGRIGGTKGATALADLRSDDRYASRALDALIALSKRNPVDRRIAAKQMGRFVGAKDEALFDRMLAAFKGMGMDGLLGLQACCENNTTADRLIDVIGRLSESKEPAVARVLSRYLQQGRGPDDARIRDAAMNGIRKMAQPKNVGDAVVPHLFPAVRNKFTRFYATQMLQEITHQLIDIRHYTSWSTWWRSTHPDWKEKENDD
jgi:hypothetical protein